MPPRPRPRTCPAQACTGAGSATASLGCLTQTATSRGEPSSSAIPSATSTSTSRKSEPNRASSICWSRSTARPSSPKPALELDPRVELHEKVTRRVAGNFLRALIAAVPYRVHTVLTDNGTHFTEPSGNTWTPDEIKAMLARKQLFRAHAFELACAQNDVAHRLTKPRHPWTNGQVERMNRTIKEATVQRFYYATHEQLRMHLADFVAAYNFARRLKTLKGLTPYEFICKRWTIEPERFRLDPLHQMPGPNSYDGLFVLRTNARITPLQAVLRYRDLIQVEQLFRTAKALMRTRPIYHSSDAAIRGHVFCSFLALILRQELDERCRNAGFRPEWGDVLRDLDRLQEMTISQDGRQMTLRTPTTGTIGPLFKAARMALPPNVRDASAA